MATPPQPAAQPSGFGATLKGKIGPLPLWAWLAIVTVLGLGYYLWERSKGGGASGATSGAADVPPPVSQTTINFPQQPDRSKVPPNGPGPTNHRPVGTGKFKEITIGGKGGTRDLEQIAKAYDISVSQLVQLNPGLKKYEGSGKPVPVKTKIRVPVGEKMSPA